MRGTLATVVDDAAIPIRVAVEEPTDGPRTVRITGDLCYSTVARLPPAAQLVGDRPGPVVADLRAVGFVDLAGWRWLASAASAVRAAHGELDVLGGPPLLRLAGFLRRALPLSAEDETTWLLARVGSSQLAPDRLRPAPRRDRLRDRGADVV